MTAGTTWDGQALGGPVVGLSAGEVEGRLDHFEAGTEDGLRVTVPFRRLAEFFRAQLADNKLFVARERSTCFL